MSDFPKIGDPILIPKGILVWESGWVPSHGQSVSKRASKGVVQQFLKFNWTDFVPSETLRDWMSRRLINCTPMNASTNPNSHPDFAAEKARIDAMLEGEYEFVSWGGRYTRKSLVQPTDKKVQKERPVTKREQMVIGSKWRFTQDVTIVAWVQPGRDLRLEEETKAWEAAGRPYDYDNPYKHCHRLPIFTVKAGTEFTVYGKHRNISWQPERAVPVTLDIDKCVDFHITYRKGDGSTGGRGMHSAQYWGENPWEYNGFHLPYNQIENFVEAIDIPDATIYVIKDKATGEYFKGFDYGDWDNKLNDWAFHLKTADTVSSAKKYVNMGALKASIMDWTGYHVGLEDPSGNKPEWVGGSKKMDLPPSYVAVAVDKITKREKHEIDLQEWYKTLARLRDLTVTCGAAVRKAYKEAEGKGFEAIATFKVDYDFTPDQKAAIQQAAKNASGKVLKATTQTSIAFACSIEDGMLIALGGSVPGVESHLYSMDKLEEIIERRAVAAEPATC